MICRPATGLSAYEALLAISGKLSVMGIKLSFTRGLTGALLITTFREHDGIAIDWLVGVLYQDGGLTRIATATVSLDGGLQVADDAGNGRCGPITCVLAGWDASACSDQLIAENDVVLITGESFLNER